MPPQSQDTLKRRVYVFLLKLHGQAFFDPRPDFLERQVEDGRDVAAPPRMTEVTVDVQD